MTVSAPSAVRVKSSSANGTMISALKVAPAGPPGMSTGEAVPPEPRVALPVTVNGSRAAGTSRSVV